MKKIFKKKKNYTALTCCTVHSTLLIQFPSSVGLEPMPITAVVSAPTNASKRLHIDIAVTTDSIDI
jgi:hypothetical protein